MGITPYEQWQRWHKTGVYTTMPLLSKQPLGLSDNRIAVWTGAWEHAFPHAIILESGKQGRYTYLGLRPTSVIRGKGLEAVVSDDAASLGRQQQMSGKPLEVVRRWMEPYKAPRLPDGPKWTGGCAGFWGYDVARYIEQLPQLAEDDLGLPDYLFMRFDELWIIDHQEGELYCAVSRHVDATTGEEELHSLYESAVAQAEQMTDLWSRLVEEDASEASIASQRRRQDLLEGGRLDIDIEALDGVSSPFSKHEFMAAVRRIQSYIAAGDLFQANLSLRQTRELASSPEEVYEWLRLVNPSPYMGFLRCPDFQLVSGSPELLVELQDGRLSGRPIAGTRRRGRTDEEEQRMIKELQTNEKERAEHIMLVDLERNDLGRISSYGSVHVKELMVIEYYSHVMHLVSQVEGRLAEGKDAYDVIAAKFPGGTITGAPKIRTMEIIEELEPVRRGPYTGSLGFIDYNGDMEFNIIIRTMAIKEGKVHIQAGAGIVIDSDPEREYYESLSKAKALWKAIQYSEQIAQETIIL
ncbi:anthranilate synthase component I family protein [Paenibacillaceae bacterium]|nr:anthranilate synthase component I family protein [Paenibacillaceae bacterium]